MIRNFSEDFFQFRNKKNKNKKNGKEIKIDIYPKWFKYIDEIDSQFLLLKNKIDEISRVTKSESLPQFDILKEKDIQQLFKDAFEISLKIKNAIKIFEVLETKECEEKIKMNLLKIKTNKFKELFKRFCETREIYLKNQTRRKTKMQDFSLLKQDEPKVEMVSVSFNKSQMEMINMNNLFIDERQKDISKISTSVQELSEIFQDMQILVSSQGPILDNIEFNINNTDNNVTKGEKDLLITKESAKSSNNRMCIILLCIFILLVLFLIVLRIILK